MEWAVLYCQRRDTQLVMRSALRSAFSVQRPASTAAFYGREGEGGLVLLLERPRTPTIGWTARARRASVPLRTHGSPRVIVAGWVIDFCSRAPPAGITILASAPAIVSGRWPSSSSSTNRITTTLAHPLRGLW